MDGSFMLNAIRNKIDFLDQLEQMGFVPKVPREVLQELKDLHGRSKFANRAILDQLFELIEKRGVKKLGLGVGKVDEQLLKLGKKGIYIATTDSTLGRMIPNRVTLSVSKKQVSVERA